MPEQIRASDADRQHVVGALERHAAAGRLDLVEFTERVDAALAARTLGDLAEVVRDLPAEPVVPPVGTGRGRQLLVAMLIAVVALLIIRLLVALR